MAFMRKSKFRHVFGTAMKKDQCYDGIRITRMSWESTYCAMNPKFVAIITEAAGGGSFLVIPLSKTGRQNLDQPQVAGHKNAVLDVAWCPHNDNMIASASEDCTIKVWQIPDEGLSAPLTEPLISLEQHQRRVTSVVWHPTAGNVLLSASSDNTIIIWNLETLEAHFQIDMPDQIYSCSFNEDGSKFACTCKDKKLRIVDSHTGEVLKTGQSHMGSKPAQCAYLKDGQVFSTGFSRMSERQYALWNEKDLESPIVMEEIDSSNGVMFIFYDPDTSMVYLAGKGDSCIRYYEITDESPYVHWLSMYQSNSPQRGIGWMPKLGLNIRTNEIARFCKLHNNGFCEIIPFTVPRKSELFQEDLYPPTASDEPAISADEFFGGKNAKPHKVSLKESFASSGGKKEPSKVQKKSGLGKMTPKGQSGNNSAEAAAAPTLPPNGQAQGMSSEELKELTSALAELKQTVKSQEKRITTLESQLAALEASHHTDEEEETEEQAA